MKQKLMASSFLALMLVCGACSSTSGTTAAPATGDAVALTTVQDLPAATGPVLSEEESASLSALTQVRSLVSLGEDTTIDDFDPDTGSYVACEMVNRQRGALAQAAQADMVMCFMKAMITEDFLTTNEIDIYDGEEHAFDLDFGDSSEGGSPDHIKLSVIKTDDVITGFELFGCVEGTQTFYISQNIDGTDFTMVSKGTSPTGESETSSVDYASSVTGTLDENGNFVGSKIIELDYVNDFGDDTGNYCDTTTTQTDATLSFTGYCKNTGGDNTAAEALVALVTLDDADGSEDLNDWSLGAGAGVINSELNTEGSDVEQGWDADGNVDAEAEFLADISGEVPPEASETAPDVAFGEGQTYDCSATAEATVEGDATAIQASCLGYNLTQNHIECQDTLSIE